MLSRTIRNAVLAQDVAAFLELPLLGDDCAIEEACTPQRLKPNAVTYLPHGYRLPDAHPSSLLVLTGAAIQADDVAQVVTPTPREDLVRVVEHFFTTKVAPGVAESARLSSTARCGAVLYLGEGAVVDRDVSVGDGSAILANAVVRGRVEIGRRCLIKTNASVGTESFGFFVGEAGWLARPEVGRIILGDDVWVGANSSIERAGLDDTCVGDGVRIDDLVHVGSDVMIGQMARIEAGTVICRRASIGERAIIGPRSVIAQGRSVGAGSVIGAGSVVLDDVPDAVVAVGSPARVLRKATSGDLEDPGF